MWKYKNISKIKDLLTYRPRDSYRGSAPKNMKKKYIYVIPNQKSFAQVPSNFYLDLNPHSRGLKDHNGKGSNNCNPLYNPLEEGVLIRYYRGSSASSLRLYVCIIYVFIIQILCKSVPVYILYCTNLLYCFYCVLWLFCTILL